jgi:hypothetical protein
MQDEKSLNNYICKIRLQKFLLVLALFSDLIAGSFISYYSRAGDNSLLLLFLAYAVGVLALYIERWRIPSILISLIFSTYSVIMLRNGQVFCIVSIALKGVSLFFKGWLILKSEINVLKRVLDYLKGNPQLFFILPFVLLVMLAAVELAMGNPEIADRFAAYAYYQLIGGALVALTFTWKNGGKYKK